MGLFDAFKKKPQAQQPQQQAQEQLTGLDLEQLLVKAATEPAYRPQLYRQLLTDTLVIMIQDSSKPPGEQVLQPNTNVQIPTLDNGQLPVFTSKDRILDNGVVKHEVQYLQMKGEDLFRFAKGATFVLNPFSSHGKELIPGEIEGMLNGSIFDDAAKELIIEKDTEVVLGQPAEYPKEIVQALTQLFEQRPAVTAAYLGWIHYPASTDPAHYIFAIDGDELKKLEAVLQEAGPVITATGYQGMFDLVVIDYNSTFSDYFLIETAPFYIKS